jgi:para-nitrobenzyl esterase
LGADDEIVEADAGRVHCRAMSAGGQSESDPVHYPLSIFNCKWMKLMRKAFIIALSAAMVCAMVLLAVACNSRTPISTLLKIDDGYISGTVNSDKPVRIFRGIPYAAPPEGDLRWKPPQPIAPWSGIRECTVFCATPSQDIANPVEGSQAPVGEDCLYLNVQTPAESASDKLPVMVWFHGGCFHMGSGNTLDSNSPALPEHGIVLVSVTHRLGVMGLMAASELSGESPHSASGNYMALDLIASLKWIQRNIAAFGGDPDNITIAGFSGGGGKVIGMLASPLAEGLFHKAIIESGSLYMLFPGVPLADQEAVGAKLFAKLGVATLAEARALDWKTVEKANSELGTELNAFTPAGPVWNYTVDGYVFPESHDKIIKKSNHNAVPLLAVANYGEIFNAGPSMGRQIPAYMDIFNGNIKKGVVSYACVFGLVPAGWRKLGGVTGHGNELPYVFGFIDLPWAWGEMRIGSAFGQKRPEGLTADAGVTDEDIQDANKVMAIWAQFMKTGNPSVKDLIEWPAWDASGNKYGDIGYPFQVKSGYSLLGQ